MDPVLAASGIFTPIIQSAAAAIAAGAILGGFLGTTVAAYYGLPRKEVESASLRDGYFGALGGFLLWLVDQCIV